MPNAEFVNEKTTEEAPRAVPHFHSAFGIRHSAFSSIGNWKSEIGNGCVAQRS
jgi:hypothetical protein